MSKTAYLYTLGCRLNQADSALMTSRLRQKGYEIINTPEGADLILVNTCAVTGEAVRKSLQTIRTFHTRYPASRIVALGCAVESNSDSFQEIPGVFSGYNADKHHPEDPVRRHLSRECLATAFVEEQLAAFPFHTRALVKIQEGCDNFCTYCIVPLVRGPSRSRKFSECVAECRQALAAGHRELVFTGVNICDYHDDGRNLEDLIREVSALPGDFRIRLGSTEPHPDDLTLVRLMADPRNKLCRFLHLSVQHGSNRILRQMNRRYLAEQFENFVKQARELVPQIHIGSDFIVGFPGETEEDFEATCQFAERVGFAKLHLFIYSPRPGTAAEKFPHRVPSALAKQRLRILQEIGNASRQQFLHCQEESLVPVIFEQVRQGKLVGWSDNYISVSVPAGTAVKGVIVPVRLEPGNCA